MARARDGDLRCVVGAAAFLLGCPQLLDDSFTPTSATAPTQVGSGGSADGGGVGGADGSAGGSAGAAGTSGTAGAAGSAGGVLEEVPDASSGGGAGGSAGGGAAPDAGSPPQTVLGEALLHRYRFDGSGSVVSDSAGAAHGTAVNATLAGSGKIALSGVDEYVNLPNGIISTRESVTLEIWVNWFADPASSAANWQTLVSFGSNAGGEDAQGNGTTYLQLVSKSGDTGDIHAAYTESGPGSEIAVDGERPLPLSTDAARGTQVVLVVDGGEGRLAVYVDGALEVESPAGQAIDLAAIDDVNNWLGRSQFPTDPELAGELLEFRVYGSALSAADVALSFDLGPDATL